jgi:hypothetical protein
LEFGRIGGIIGSTIREWDCGMTLLDGGKENWSERVRSRTYWTLYFLIPLFTIAHIDRSYQDHDGQEWKWLLWGVALMALAIWRRPRSE